MTFSMGAIAHMQSGFPTKFGVPRQSGLVPSLESTVVFAPEFRNPDALRGLAGFSHLWLIWVFDRALRGEWSPTVRPPRLGGNQRMGVFATRSPFRPNPIGLSCVELAGIELSSEQGPLLRVRGADLADGTPILDIKPYVPYADSRPEARSGFAPAPGESLEVVIPPELLERIAPELREPLRGVLAQDPRPRYQEDPDRVYGFGFAGMEIKFSVAGGRAVVVDVRESRPDGRDGG